MPPKTRKQDPTPAPPVPGAAPSLGATPAAGPQPSPAASAAPADQGNPNAPDNFSPSLSQSGAFHTDKNTGLTTATLVVNGKLITLTLNSDIQADWPVATGTRIDDTQSFQTSLNSIQDWYKNTSTRQKYINEMYAAGLLTSKKSPGVQEVALAWQLVTQEAALQYSDASSSPELRSPESLLAAAAKGGWKAVGFKQATTDVEVQGTGNPNNSTEAPTQSETVYKSYVDPATAMGALADSYYRLMGRNPNSGEYQAFLDSIRGYQDEVNTGSDKSVVKGPSAGNLVDPLTGAPVDQSGINTGGTPPTAGTSTQTNVVSQRSIGQRGLEFLAGQAAMANPEEAQYQAATTVFSSIIKALGGPGAAGSSGPTTSAP